MNFENNKDDGFANLIHNGKIYEVSAILNNGISFECHMYDKDACYGGSDMVSIITQYQNAPLASLDCLSVAIEKQDIHLFHTIKSHLICSMRRLTYNKKYMEKYILYITDYIVSIAMYSWPEFLNYLVIHKYCVSNEHDHISDYLDNYDNLFHNFGIEYLPTIRSVIENLKSMGNKIDDAFYIADDGTVIFDSSIIKHLNRLNI